MKKPPAHVPAAPARRLWTAAIIACLLTVVPIAAGYLCKVPLGEPGRFIYRYTPIIGLRALSLPMLALPIVLLWLTARLSVDLRFPIAAYAAAVLTLATLIAWNYWAPPAQLRQHAFNFRSPSHEGAFVYEAELPISVTDYLLGFDRRLQLSVEKMRGTRVLANPPMMTVVFREIFDACPIDPDHADWLRRTFFDDGMIPSTGYVIFEHSLVASLTCAVMLFLAGLAAMGLGRQFLSPLGAIAFAIIVVFNPMTVHFNPGKDPGQLLTICLMLWLWFAGWTRRSILLSAAAGAVLIIGMAFGLIHLWIALAAGIATLWQGVDEREGLRFFRASFWPVAAGAVGLMLIVWAVTGWKMASTFLAVAHRWRELQPELHYSRGLWLMIGLPIVLVFVSPGLWLLLFASARRLLPAKSLGAKLALCTLAAMATTYLIGIPYELPRLWVVFLPSLTLGLMMLQPLARGRSHQRVATLITLLLILHVLGTAIHWTFLDARESEYRLISERAFN